MQGRDKYGEISWIWGVAGSESIGDKELDESVQVEWSKLLARTERWQEEVEIEQEEMRRALKYFEWKCQWWKGIMKEQKNESKSLMEGLISYGEQQAGILEEMMMRCSKQWQVIVEKEWLDSRFIISAFSGE